MVQLETIYATPVIIGRDGDNELKLNRASLITSN